MYVVEDEKYDKIYGIELHTEYNFEILPVYNTSKSPAKKGNRSSRHKWE